MFIFFSIFSLLSNYRDLRSVLLLNKSRHRPSMCIIYERTKSYVKHLWEKRCSVSLYLYTKIYTHTCVCLCIHRLWIEYTSGFSNNKWVKNTSENFIMYWKPLILFRKNEKHNLKKNLVFFCNSFAWRKQTRRRNSALSTYM